jgi:flagellar basal-body rod protein FlgG
MIKGLYSAFTALEAAWRYQDVLANNISNADTAGFKREFATQQPFADVLLSQQAAVPAPISSRIQQVVGQIGTGTFIANFATDFGQGILRETDNELDVSTTNGFFHIEGPDGTVYATRDGRFGRDANGDLVTSQGFYVLDDAGQHINLPQNAVSIDSDGVILDQGNPIARLGILDYTPNQLNRAGEAYFTPTDQGQEPLGGRGVRQGFLEGSNSNLVEEMTSLLAVQRTYQANQTILSTLDGTLNQAAGELGRL